MPPNAAVAPARPKASSFVLSTRTLVGSAACLLPPAPKMWLPIRFRSSRPQKASASTAHHRNVAGITPTLPAVRDANTGSGAKGWEDAPCTKNVAANQNKDVPSVAQKDGHLSQSAITP